MPDLVDIYVHRPCKELKRGWFLKFVLLKCVTEIWMIKEEFSAMEEPRDFSFYLAEANLIPQTSGSRQKRIASSDLQNTKRKKNTPRTHKKQAGPTSQRVADCVGQRKRAIQQFQNQGRSLTSSGLMSECSQKLRNSIWRVSGDKNCDNSRGEILNSPSENSVEKVSSFQLENSVEKISSFQSENSVEKMSNSHENSVEKLLKSQCENSVEKISNFQNGDNDFDEKPIFQEQESSFQGVSKFLKEKECSEKMLKRSDIKNEQIEHDIDFVHSSPSTGFSSNELGCEKNYCFKNGGKTIDPEYKCSRKHGKVFAVFRCPDCNYECRKMSTLSRHLFVDHSNSSVPLISEDIYKFEENATVTTKLVGHNCASPCGKDDVDCPCPRITYEPKRLPNRYQRQLKWTIQEKKELLYCYYYSRYEYWSRKKCHILKEMIEKSDLPQNKKSITVSKMHSLVSQIYKYLAYKDIEDIKENALKKARDDYFERQEEEILEVKRKHWSREQKWILLWAIEYSMQKHSCQSACRLEWRRIFDHFCPEKKGMSSCNLMTQKNNFRRFGTFEQHEISYLQLQVRHLIESEKNPVTNPIPLPVKPSS